MNKMKKYAIVLGVTSVASLGIVFAQTPSATGTQTSSVQAAPGLTPDNPFYFLDKFAEQLDLFLTFNKAERARLQVSFAKERIAEIKEMLSTGTANKAYIDSAKETAKENLTSVSATLDEEKKNGTDTSSLEKELREDYDSTKHEFESYAEEESHNIEREQNRLSKEMEVKGISEDKKNELKAKIKELDDKKSLIKEVGDDEDLNDAEDSLDSDTEAKDENKVETEDNDRGDEGSSSDKGTDDSSRGGDMEERGTDR